MNKFGFSTWEHLRAGLRGGFMTKYKGNAASCAPQTGLIGPRFIKTASASAFALAVALLPGISSAQQAWDTVGANNAVDGGTGTWDAATTTNWTTDGGMTNVVYDDGPPAPEAIFGGTADTVTIFGGQGITDLTFNVGGYVFNGDQLAIDDAGSTITIGGGDTVTFNNNFSDLGPGSGKLTIDGGGTVNLNGANTHSGGTEVINASTVNLSGTLTSFVTNNGGTINMTGGSQSGGNFSNSVGTLNVNATGSVGFLNISTTGSGPGTATVNIADAVTLNGTGGVNVNDGGTLNVGTTAGGGAILSTGSVLMNGNSNLTNNGTITGGVDIDNQTGGTVTNNGTMTAGGGTGSFLIVNDTVTFTNNGTLNGNLTINGATAVGNLEAGSQILGGSTVNVTNGTLNVNGVAGDSVSVGASLVSVQANGTLAIDAGVDLNNSGGLISSGTVTMGNGAEVNVNGGAISGGSFTIGTSTDLTTTVVGGMTVTGNVVLTNNGTITGDVDTTGMTGGSITNTGSMGPGAGNFLQIANGVTFTNSGTITGNLTNSGTATLNNGSVFTGATNISNASTGTMEMNGLINMGIAAFANSSTSATAVTVNAGANVTANNFTFSAGTSSNAGTLNGTTILSNASILNNTGTLNGAVNIGLGTTIPGGTLNNNAGSNITGNVTVRNGGTFNNTAGTAGGNVTLIDAATLVNNATISGTVDADAQTSGTITNTTSITAGGAGGFLQINNGVTLNNSGTINGNLTNSGIANLNNGTVISGATNVSNAGTGTMVMDGTINMGAAAFGNSSTSAMAVTVNAGANVTANNFTFSAGTSSNAGTLNGTTILSNASILNNTGTLNGAVNIGLGTTIPGGTLNNNAGSNITGNVTVRNGGTFNNTAGTAGGNMTLIDAATLVNNATISGTVDADAQTSGTITNTTSITAGGGTGNVLNINNGVTLNNSGAIVGTLINNGIANLMNGTTQAGGGVTNINTANVSGAVATSTFDNQGTLDMSDGATGDALSVTGNLVIQGGSTLQVDVDPVAANSDTIGATGTAFIAGTIDVNLLSNGVAATIPIVTATGGVTDAGATLGTLTGVINPITTVALDFTDPNTLAVSLTLNAVLGNFNPNQTAIIDNINGGSSPGALGALLGLPTQQATANALDQLSPELYLNLQNSVANAAEDALDTLFSCDVTNVDNAAVQQGNCLWLEPRGRVSDTDTTALLIGFDERAYGLSMGGQWNTGDGKFVGLTAGFEQVSLDADNGATSQAQRYHVGASLKHIDGPAYLGAAVVAGFGNFDADRINLLGTNSSESEEFYVAGSLRAAYLFEQAEYYLKPMVDLDAMFVQINGFTETGTAATALTVPDFDDVFFAVTPAIELGTEWAGGDDSTIRAFGRIGGRFQTEGDRDLTAGFAVAPLGTPNFTISTQREEFLVDFAAGVTVFNDNGSSFSLEYQGKVGSETNQHSIFAKGSIKF